MYVFDFDGKLIYHVTTKQERDNSEVEKLQLVQNHFLENYKFDFEKHTVNDFRGNGWHALHS